jgi:hypothetical protein
LIDGVWEREKREGDEREVPHEEHDPSKRGRHST